MAACNSDAHSGCLSAPGTSTQTDNAEINFPRMSLFSSLTTYEKLVLIPRVCTYWAIAVQDEPNLWTEVEINEQDHIPTSTILAQLDKSPFLRKLTVSGITSFDCSDIMRSVVASCSNLQSLTLSNCCISDQAVLEEMRQFCDRLGVLEVKNSYDSRTNPIDHITCPIGHINVPDPLSMDMRQRLNAMLSPIGRTGDGGAYSTGLGTGALSLPTPHVPPPNLSLSPLMNNLMPNSWYRAPPLRPTPVQSYRIRVRPVVPTRPDNTAGHRRNHQNGIGCIDTALHTLLVAQVPRTSVPRYFNGIVVRPPRVAAPSLVVSYDEANNAAMVNDSIRVMGGMNNEQRNEPVNLAQGEARNDDEVGVLDTSTDSSSDEM